MVVYRVYGVVGVSLSSLGVRYLILVPTAVCHGGVRCTVVWSRGLSSHNDLPRYRVSRSVQLAWAYGSLAGYLISDSSSTGCMVCWVYGI